MSILLLINAIFFMVTSSIIWLPLTFLWCVIIFAWDTFVAFIYLFNDNGFQIGDVLSSILFGFKEGISKIDDLFKWFWEFGRYNHPILALCASILLAGGSSRI